jgi:hypothetical protein
LHSEGDACVGVGLVGGGVGGAGEGPGEGGGGAAGVGCYAKEEGNAHGCWTGWVRSGNRVGIWMEQGVGCRCVQMENSMYLHMYEQFGHAYHVKSLSLDDLLLPIVLGLIIRKRVRTLNISSNHTGSTGTHLP